MKPTVFSGNSRFRVSASGENLTNRSLVIWNMYFRDELRLAAAWIMLMVEKFKVYGNSNGRGFRHANVVGMPRKLTAGFATVRQLDGLPLLPFPQ